jgi:hypothetical protein
MSDGSEGGDGEFSLLEEREGFGFEAFDGAAGEALFAAQSGAHGTGASGSDGGFFLETRTFECRGDGRFQTDRMDFVEGLSAFLAVVREDPHLVVASRGTLSGAMDLADGAIDPEETPMGVARGGPRRWACSS